MGTPVFLKSISGLEEDNLVKNEWVQRTV